MKFLTMQLEYAGLKGVYVVENGEHLCTMYPRAWGHMVDRAEFAFCSGTSYAWLVERACGHCLTRRSDWLGIRQGLDWWAARRRCRSQMLMAADTGVKDRNKCGGNGASSREVCQSAGRCRATHTVQGVGAAHNGPAAHGPRRPRLHAGRLRQLAAGRVPW